MVLSVLVPTLSIFVIFSPFKKLNYILYNYHKVVIIKELLREDPLKIDLDDWRGHKILLYENDTISIRDKGGAIILYVSDKDKWLLNNHFKDHNYNKILSDISI